MEKVQKKVEQEVNEIIPGIILMSHGPLAVGLLETARMLFGEIENIEAYSLEEGENLEEYYQHIVDAIKKFPTGVIVFIDIFGGTPCNQMMRYIQEQDKVIEVVTGMNLPMLIHAATTREKINKEFTINTANVGREGIFRIDVESFLDDETENNN